MIFFVLEVVSNASDHSLLWTHTHMLVLDIHTKASMCCKTLFNILLLSVVKMTKIKIMLSQETLSLQKVSIPNGLLESAGGLR